MTGISLYSIWRAPVQTFPPKLFPRVTNAMRFLDSSQPDDGGNVFIGRTRMYDSLDLFHIQMSTKECHLAAKEG
jgi:hypothetical protein